MLTSVDRFDARPWPNAYLEALFADAFPAFITAVAVAAVYIDRVREWFAVLNIMLVRDDEPVATGWGVLIRWNGDIDDLPTGLTDTTRRAIELRRPTSLKARHVAPVGRRRDSR